MFSALSNIWIFMIWGATLGALMGFFLMQLMPKFFMRKYGIEGDEQESFICWFSCLARVSVVLAINGLVVGAGIFVLGHFLIKYW